MKDHPGSASVQENGCGALMNISVLTENRAKVAEAGNIEAVVAAMEGHPGSASVQENGCGALRNISLLAENRAKVAAAGGLSVVEEALQLHRGVSYIQTHGKSLMEVLQKLVWPSIVSCLELTRKTSFRYLETVPSPSMAALRSAAHYFAPQTWRSEFWSKLRPVCSLIILGLVLLLSYGAGKWSRGNGFDSANPVRCANVVSLDVRFDYLALYSPPSSYDHCLGCKT